MAVKGGEGVQASPLRVTNNTFSTIKHSNIDEQWPLRARGGGGKLFNGQRPLRKTLYVIGRSLIHCKTVP